MPEFGPDDIVELGYGVELRTIGVSGEARDALRVPGTTAPVRDLPPGMPTEFLALAGAGEAAATLGAAIAGSDLRLQLTVDLPTLIAPQSGPAVLSRDATTVPHLEVTVDPPAIDEAQVLLEVDQTGHVRWHLPRIAGSRQRFAVRVDQFTTAAGDDPTRGLIGFGVRKVLHLLRFPVETAAGWVAEQAVRWWEDNHRPSTLRLAHNDGSYGPEVDASYLANADGGPWLLFVHGTFSTGATFGDLHGDFGPWHQNYGGRLLVFDHPTVATTPEANAQWLLDRLPTDRRLDVDVVTHSRGGLVARQLVVQPDSERLDIRRLVQVASPNAGTVLASPTRLGDLIDTCTNLFALVPDSAGGAALSAVLEVVKQVAVGALSGLDGLAAMDPACADLAALNARNWTAAAANAVTSDYRPEASDSLARHTLDAMVDAVFAAAGNDLVVPTAGMSDAGGFVVASPYVAASPTLTHSGYFADAAVRAEIRRCLALPVTSPLRA